MIERHPRAAASRDYDAIVVGGGIHGCMALLQAALAGRRVLLIERGDFGAETSFNSLRIVHGGLRYLQSLDLPRFYESVAERRWLLRAYPDLVKPLPCLMPLYSGLKRPAVLRAALAVNDALSIHRNRGVRADRRLPAGRTLTVAEVRRLCPFVRHDGLKGGALWYDACVPDSHRVVMETLRWAVAKGAVALNYVEALGLGLEGNRVAAVEACDRISGERHRFRAPIVINAAGPWSSELLERFGEPAGTASFSIAWNVLFDRPAGMEHALALSPPWAGAQTYFMHPWKGRLLIGTGHRGWRQDGAALPTGPGDEALSEFLADVNAAAPGLKLTNQDVVRVLFGLLPSIEPGSARLSKRPEIIDHGSRGGSKGLFSMIGIKFTTARRTAARTLSLSGLAGDLEPPWPAPLDGVGERGRSITRETQLLPGDLDWVRELAQAESVCTVDDMVYRRLGLIHDSMAAERVAHLLRNSSEHGSGRAECR